jgi:hypothetical protein
MGTYVRLKDPHHTYAAAPQIFQRLRFFKRQPDTDESLFFSCHYLHKVISDIQRCQCLLTN